MAKVQAFETTMAANSGATTAGRFQGMNLAAAAPTISSCPLPEPPLVTAEQSRVETKVQREALFFLVGKLVSIECMILFPC